MINPLKTYRKRMKRKVIAARRLKHERDIRYLAGLPQKMRIRILTERVRAARLLKAEKRLRKQKLEAKLNGPIQTNKQIKI